jgi:hypothetical protein
VLSQDRDQSGPSSFPGKGRIKDRYISATNQGTLLHMDQCQWVHLRSSKKDTVDRDDSVRARSKAVWIHVIHGVLCTQHDMRCVRWNLGPADSCLQASRSIDRSVELHVRSDCSSNLTLCSDPAAVFLMFLFYPNWDCLLNTTSRYFSSDLPRLVLHYPFKHMLPLLKICVTTLSRAIFRSCGFWDGRNSYKHQPMAGHGPMLYMLTGSH